MAHLVRYDDMKADTVGTSGRPLAFVGEPATDADIRRAVAFANFAELRRRGRTKGYRQSPQWYGGPFFCRAEAGAWRGERHAFRCD